MSEYRSGWISLLWKMNGCHMLRYINFIANLSCGSQYQNKLCQTMKICTVALYISRHIIPNMSTAIRISNCKMRLIRTFVDDNVIRHSFISDLQGANDLYMENDDILECFHKSNIPLKRSTDDCVTSFYGQQMIEFANTTIP